MMRLAVAAPFLAVVAPGCVTSSPPPVLHYYRPALPNPSDAASADAAVAAATPLALRRVSAAPHLREFMAHRVSAVEYAFDEVNRWLAPPAVLVADALERGLFGEAGFRRDDSADAVLEVRVVAFERSGDHAEVELEATLAARGAPPRMRTVRVTRPVAGDGADALADAIGASLQAAVRELAAFVRGG